MSFLMDAATGDWSDELLALTGLPRGLLPPIRDPLDVIGPLTPEAAAGSACRRGCRCWRGPATIRWRCSARG